MRQHEGEFGASEFQHSDEASEDYSLKLKSMTQAQEPVKGKRLQVFEHITLKSGKNTKTIF